LPIKFINLNNFTLNTIKVSVALINAKEDGHLVHFVVPSILSVLSISKCDANSNNRITKAFASASAGENVQNQQQRQPSEQTLAGGSAGPSVSGDSVLAALNETTPALPYK
jgi:hypothetical protein